MVDLLRWLAGLNDSKTFKLCPDYKTGWFLIKCLVIAEPNILNIYVNCPTFPCEYWLECVGWWLNKSKTTEKGG